MANYSKKVVYLSYLEQGSRIKGAGFVKVETIGEKWSFDMRVSGMMELSDRKYDIYIINLGGKEYRIGGIFLHRGCGEWKESGEGGAAGMEEPVCRGLGGFLIKISGEKAIEGKYRTPETENVRKTLRAAEEDESRGGEKSRMEKRLGAEGEARMTKNSCAKGEAHMTKNSCMEREARMTENSCMEGKSCMTREACMEGKSCMEGKFRMTGKSRQEKGEKASRMGGAILESKKKTNREILDNSHEKEIKMEEVILNDKWEQLRQMYPVVHPYEDEREYISIQPKDFVVMTGDYQHLANNSFLLHGFYNYRHIVLGREPRNETAGNADMVAAGRGGADKRRGNEKEGKEKAGKGKTVNERAASGGIADVEERKDYEDFYLGVPGVYYEREKMVALMFGFEAFECCGGKAEPGKFGYYLRRVKI